MDNNNFGYLMRERTYKEDTEGVRESIKKLVDKKEYPKNLWD